MTPHGRAPFNPIPTGRGLYHLQLLHAELLATLEGDALLLGLLQGVVPHRGAQTDDHVHPGEGGGGGGCSQTAAILGLANWRPHSLFTIESTLHSALFWE